MSSTELCCLALEMCLVILAGPVLATVKPFPPFCLLSNHYSDLGKYFWKITLIKGGMTRERQSWLGLMGCSPFSCAGAWCSCRLGQPAAALPSSAPAGAISRWVHTGFPAPVSPLPSPNHGRPCLARVSLVTGPRDAVQSICHQLSLFCSALYAHSIVSRGR